MAENISVDEALKRANRMFLIPGIIVLIMMLILFVGFFYILAHDLVQSWILPIILFGGLFLILIVLCIIRSIKIPDWKLWAFENVRNVHELEKRAIQEKLIYRPNSFLSKTEIWTKRKRAKWEIIKEKFKQEDIFTDDLTIPSETIIYYSKSKNYVEMTIMIFCFLAGIFLIIKMHSYIIGSIFSLIGAYLSYREYKEATNTEPQITINDKGIETKSTSFKDWELIANEEAIVEGYGKNTKQYFVYEYPGGRERIQLGDLEIDLKELNKLLRIYRGRSQKKSGF